MTAREGDLGAAARRLENIRSEAEGRNTTSEGLNSRKGGEEGTKASLEGTKPAFDSKVSELSRDGLDVDTPLNRDKDTRRNWGIDDKSGR